MKNGKFFGKMANLVWYLVQYSRRTPALRPDNIDNEYGMDTLVSIVWCKIYKYGKYAYLYIKKYI